MVKVLNIIGRRPTGGVGTFTYNYQSHIDRNKVQIDYLLFTDELYGEFDDKVKALGSKVYFLPALKNLRLLVLWKKIDLFMQKIGINYDVLHLHSVNIAFMCFTTARKYGIKNLIAHSHSVVFSDNILKSLRNMILCLNINKLANIYMACSKAAGIFLFGEKNIEKVYIANNAIECHKFQFNETTRIKLRKELGIENSFVLGHIGRFSAEKNYFFLIDVFEKCLEQCKNMKLVLIGDGPLKLRIKTVLIEKKLEDKVLLLGMRSDVSCLLQAIDVFALPSLFEGLPLTAIEAQASGLPCVLSDKITNEVDIINTKHLSIDNNYSQSDWANYILSLRSKKRIDCSTFVANHGFDINLEAQKLMNFYCSYNNVNL